jgi:putative membrane protein
MMYWHDGVMGGWGPLMMVFNTVFFVGLVVVAIVIVARLVGRNTAATSSDAQTILAQRYARGEIDDEEYQRRLQVLRPGL